MNLSCILSLEDYVLYSVSHHIQNLKIIFSQFVHEQFIEKDKSMEVEMRVLSISVGMEIVV